MNRNIKKMYLRF